MLTRVYNVFMSSKWINRLRIASPYLIITFFIIALYFRNLFFWWGGRTYIFGDTAIYSLYLSAFAKNLDSLLTLKNNFLFWNTSYLAVGLPTLSLIDMGLFYPPNILIALIARFFGNVMLTFPLYTVSLYIHLAISSIFIYKILREFWDLEKPYAIFGALLWSFIGYNTEFLSAGSIFLSASYLPLCFYLKLKSVQNSSSTNLKYYMGFYVSLALSFLVGYPISSVIVYLISTLFVFSYRKGNIVRFIKKELIGVFLITTAIIAPLYFSVLINLPYSTRTKLTLDGFLSNPAKITNLTESFFPTNTPFNNTNNTNLVYLYFSLVGIILFLTAHDKFQLLKRKENIILLIMMTFGIIISLGRITVLPAILYQVIPGFSFFRRLSVFSLMPGFSFCILAPQWFKSTAERKLRPNTLLAVLAIFLFGSTLFLLFSVASNYTNHAPLFSSTSQSLIIPAAVSSIIFFALVIKKYKPKYFVSLIFIAVLLEGILNVSSKVYINSKMNPKMIFSSNLLTNTILKDIAMGERVDLLYTQHNYSVDLLNIEQTSGYLSLASNYGVQLNNALNNPNYDTSNLRDILGVSLIVKKELDKEKGLVIKEVIDQDIKNTSFYAFDYNSLSWQPEPAGTKYFIYKRPAALPRVYVTSKVLGGNQSSDLLTKIEKLDDSKNVFVSKYDMKNETLTGNGSLSMDEYKRNYVKVESDLKSSAFIAASIGYFPGWWVRINGKWTPPIQTNWFMMGTYLPNGKNTIEFIYIPYGLIIGIMYIMMSSLAWLYIKKSNFKVLR